MMDFEWKIIYIWQEEKVWQNQIPKLTIVIEEDWKEYPNSVAIDLFNEKIKLIDWFKVWDIVKASLNFRAREYNWKYFNSISSWRITKANQDSVSTSTSNTDNKVEDEDDDLPF